MTGETKTPEEVLDMSDEDFAKLTNPPAVTPEKEETPEEKAAREAAEAEAAQQAEAQNAENQQPDGEEQPPKADDEKENTEVETAPKKVGDNFEESATLSKDNSGGASTPKQEKPAVPAAKPDGQEATPPNFEESYKQLMAPIHANGKTIELHSPDELRQLAQMGANYTKKMQAIAPHRKVLMMLENNGLLDEGKLSFLIDLEKKNPEAIKKLIKEAGINPLDIDTEVEPTYREGNHRVTDEEAAFVSQLEDLKSTPEGTQTIQTINNWDQASKEVLWNNPSLMATIHSQRANGIYDTIAKEIDRRRTLGQIPTEVPFLQAYKAVGDELHNAGAFNNLGTKPPQGKTPVAVRPAVPKPPVANGDKASAAAPSRSTPKVAKPFVNPLQMSDDEFMKTFKDRL